MPRGRETTWPLPLDWLVRRPPTPARQGIMRAWGNTAKIKAPVGLNEDWRQLCDGYRFGNVSRWNQSKRICADRRGWRTDGLARHANRTHGDGSDVDARLVSPFSTATRSAREARGVFG